MELIILHDGMYQLHNVVDSVPESETNQWLIGQGKVFFGCSC